MTDYYERQFTPKELSQLKNNLYTFYRWFVVSNFEENITAPHVKYIAYKLQALTDGTLGKSRIAVNLPPQHSKSSLITVAYPAWLLLNNPKRRILGVNAEKGLSQKFGTSIKNLLANAAPFWGLELSKESHSKTSMQLTRKGDLQSGSIELTGLTGGITGRPVDYIVCDDLLKGVSDTTPTILDTKWDLYSIIIEQRLRTKDRSKLVLLSTRWDSEDIHGRILADDYQKSKYEWIILPAIATSDDDVLGRKPGELLWPQYYDLDFYKEKEHIMGEREFQAIYQQVPLDLTSDFFHTDRLLFETEFDDYAIGRCRSWDIASSDASLGDQRDYSVGVRMLKTPGNQYWIFDYERGQYGNNLKHILINTARADSPAYTILLETGAGTSDLLYNEYRTALNGYNVKQSKTHGATKEDRATPLANAIYDGQVHVLINDDNLREAFLQEFKSFPNGKHDDIVDACAYGFNYLSRFEDNSVRTAGKRHRARLR